MYRLKRNYLQYINYLLSKHLDELHIIKLFLKRFVLQMGTLKERFDLKGRAQFTLGRRLCSALSLLETMSLKSRSVNVWRLRTLFSNEHV